jgi:recombination protein RecA
MTELVNLASDVGVINKGGAWYTVKTSQNTQKFQGAEKTRLFLIENPEIAKEVEESVKNILGIKKI